MRAREKRSARVPERLALGSMGSMGWAHGEQGQLDAKGAGRFERGAWRMAISEEKAKIAKTGAFLAESHPFVSEEKAKIAELRLFLSKSHSFAKIALQIQYAEDIPVPQYIYDLP